MYGAFAVYEFCIQDMRRLATGEHYLALTLQENTEKPVFYHMKSDLSLPREGPG